MTEYGPNRLTAALAKTEAQQEIARQATLQAAEATKQVAIAEQERTKREPEQTKRTRWEASGRAIEKVIPPAVVAIAVTWIAINAGHDVVRILAMFGVIGLFGWLRKRGLS